jgi:hypothetical protein
MFSRSSLPPWRRGTMWCNVSFRFRRHFWQRLSGFGVSSRKRCFFDSAAVSVGPAAAIIDMVGCSHSAIGSASTVLRTIVEVFLFRASSSGAASAFRSGSPSVGLQLGERGDLKPLARVVHESDGTARDEDFASLVPG